MTKQALLIFSYFYLFNFTITAQYNDALNSQNHLRGFLIKATQLESGIKTVTYSDIEGSPFLNKEYSLGKVFTKEGVFNDVKMKYDIYTDAFLFDMTGVELYLEATEYVKKVVLNNNTFVISTLPATKKKAGFVVQLDSNKVSLFAKKNIYFRAEEPAKALEAGPTPASFLPRATKYFLKVGFSPLVQIEKMKDVFELFPAEEVELKKYIKSENLIFKNEEDLVKIARFVSRGI